MRRRVDGEPARDDVAAARGRGVAACHGDAAARDGGVAARVARRVTEHAAVLALCVLCFFDVFVQQIRRCRRQCEAFIRKRMGSPGADDCCVKSCSVISSPPFDSSSCTAEGLFPPVRTRTTRPRGSSGTHFCSTKLASTPNARPEDNSALA
mmetsp:Transcript_2594/g.7540  ORF Transcript_2594/g.7540 Transcript_2594/m.7540 type:complete len:152 (+) Transcript_2594:800-1255(+)